MSDQYQRLAIVTNSGRGAEGGIVRIVERMGSDATIIVPPDEGSVAMRTRGLDVEDWHLNRKARWLGLEVIAATYRLTGLLRRREIRIAHSLGHLSNVCTFFACLISRTPYVVLAITGLGSVFLGPRVILRSVLKWFYRIAAWAGASIVCENAADRDYFSCIPPNRLDLLVHAGVDLAFFGPQMSEATRQRLRTELELDGCVVVTFVGRLIAHKGVRELIQGWTRIERAHQNARLLIIGGPDPGNVAGSGILDGAASESVHFLGRRDDVPDLLALSDIVVNPSYREGMSRVNMEALASGKALVTTQAPGCAEMVEDGVNGILVPVGDTGALAAAIARLLSDPELRASMGRAGRLKAVQEFSLERVAQDMLRFHRQVGRSALIGSIRTSGIA